MVYGPFEFERYTRTPVAPRQLEKPSPYPEAQTLGKAGVAGASHQARY